VTTLQPWMDAVGDLVYSLFGVDAQLFFQEYGTVFLVVAAALVLGAAGLMALLALRVARRGWRSLVGDLPLWRTRDGRQALRLAREIRRGSRRLRRILLTMEAEAREHAGLLGLVERFTRRQLPETLAQLQTFIETGGARRTAALARTLAGQEREWAEAGEAERRKTMERAIAGTRQRLLQARHADAERSRLLDGLQEAALALRTLEVELASLGATRSEAIRDLRTQLGDVADGLRHQRQAHAELQDPA